jgi:carbonic anhydrase/acetyltransferase-like protein (isoleucine patch superfamily)
MAQEPATVTCKRLSSLITCSLGRTVLFIKIENFSGSRTIAGCMTIEEILMIRPELVVEKLEDYIRHKNPDGKYGGWHHKTASIGKSVSIGEGSIVLEYASMGNHSRIGNYSMMGAHAKMGDHSRIGNYSTMGNGEELSAGCILFSSRSEDLTALAASRSGLSVREFRESTNRPARGRWIPSSIVSSDKIAGRMTIDEILMVRPELVNEKPGDYIQHKNPDGKNGGWYHRTASIGKNVFIGEGSIVLEHASMADHSTIGYYSTIGTHAEIGDHSRIGNYSTMSDYSKMGSYSTMGDLSTMGNHSTMLHDSTMGDGEKLSAGCILFSPLNAALAASNSVRHTVRQFRKSINLSTHGSSTSTGHASSPVTALPRR